MNSSEIGTKEIHWRKKSPQKMLLEQQIAIDMKKKKKRFEMYYFLYTNLKIYKAYIRKQRISL